MNLPEYFVHRIQKEHGNEAEDFFSSLKDKAPISIRKNPDKRIAIETDGQVSWCSSGFYLSERPVFTLDPLFHAGGYYVQEPSSMFVEQVFQQYLSSDEPLVVLDLCAAPGGKSTHIASLLNERSLLVANEVISSRAKILTENIIKWGSGNVIVTNNNPADFSQFKNLFDVILMDAPCSGEGLFRKDADAIKEWSPDNAQMCSRRQRKILYDVMTALKPGGLLIYSTCTFNPGENEHNVDWTCSEFALECLPLKLKDEWGIEEKKSGKCTGYHFYPHKVKGEGLFLSVMRRSGNNVSPVQEYSKQKIFSPLKKEFSFVEGWMNTNEEKKLFAHNDKVVLLPEKYLSLITGFHHQLRVLYEGVEIGTIKNDKVIPAHSLAMYKGLKKDSFPCMELAKENALKYLRREEIALTVDAPGWKLITYCNTPLGWIKHLGNRINNYYPTEWRIRMRG